MMPAVLIFLFSSSFFRFCWKTVAVGLVSVLPFTIVIVNSAFTPAWPESLRESMLNRREGQFFFVSTVFFTVAFMLFCIAA